MMETRSASSNAVGDVEVSVFKSWSNKASGYHSRVPYLNKLPFPALAIIVTLIVVNVLVWVAVGVVLVHVSLYFPSHPLTNSALPYSSHLNSNPVVDPWPPPCPRCGPHLCDRSHDAPTYRLWPTPRHSRNVFQPRSFYHCRHHFSCRRRNRRSGVVEV